MWLKTSINIKLETEDKCLIQMIRIKYEIIRCANCFPPLGRDSKALMMCFKAIILRDRGRRRVEGGSQQWNHDTYLLRWGFGHSSLDFLDGSLNLEKMLVNMLQVNCLNPYLVGNRSLLGWGRLLLGDSSGLSSLGCSSLWPSLSTCVGCRALLGSCGGSFGDGREDSWSGVS